MSVTRAELEGAVEVLNDRLDLPTDGQSLGSIYTYGAYGGWQLMQIAPAGSDHVTRGFVSKPALYAKTWDIIKGIDLARKYPRRQYTTFPVDHHPEIPTD